MSETSKRNEIIFKMWKQDRMTMSAIARLFGLSRERIRQIVRREEVR